MITLRDAVAASRYRGGLPPSDPASWDLASFGAALTRSTDKLTVSKGSGGGATYSSARSVGQCPATSDRYFTATLTDPSASPFAMVGVATAAMPANGATAYPGGTTAGHSYYEQNGNRYTNAVATAYGTSYGTGAVIVVAYKGSTGQLFFRKNGVWQNSGNPSTGAGAITITPDAYYAAVGLYANGHAWTADFTTVDADPLLAAFTPWVP
jgi:hypothetical protein